MASLAIGAGASLLSGILGGKGASKAAKAQAAALQSGIDEQHRQFDVTQQNFAPYLGAGTQALGQFGNLVGLNGNDAQGSAIDFLKASPGFTSLYNQGSDTILQNAAATGGLRGGNTQNSLAQFGSGLLAQTIQQQLAQLGGLVQTGSGAAGSLGQFGQNTANSVSTLLGQQGAANANAIAAPYGALQGTINQLGAMKFGGGGGADSKATVSAPNFTFPGLQALGW